MKRLFFFTFIALLVSTVWAQDNTETLDPPFTDSSPFIGIINLVNEAINFQQVDCNERTDAIGIKCGLVQIGASDLKLGLDMAMINIGAIRQGDWVTVNDNTVIQLYRADESNLQIELHTIEGNIHALIYREVTQ